MLKTIAFLAILLALVVSVELPTMLQPNIVAPTGFTAQRASNKSVLYEIGLPAAPTARGMADYAAAPLLLHLRGSRFQIGYDYAALLSEETDYTLNAFLTTVFPEARDRELVTLFIDYCWEAFLRRHTPAEFLEELRGMAAFHADHPAQRAITPSDVVSQRFYTLANMPADAVNIIAMLEQEEEKGWPAWLRTAVNDIVRLLERMAHKCDAYGAWGSRTDGGLLYSSRNLDYQQDTGINRYKLVTVFDIDDAAFGGRPRGGAYATMGFAYGPGALAGMNAEGVTTSEMNLDNSVVTFDGVPFPLRLRFVLENGVDLASAMGAWHATNNTNSFNFLIGSARDAAAGTDGAYALETIRGYTAVFGADSPVERAATYDCRGDACHGWTRQTGEVHIGRPLPEAVWRSNHGMAPRVMATQEPLFNNTVFRYDLMHDLFAGIQAAGVRINDTLAVRVVATLGTKGRNYLTCEQPLDGDNVMSIAYAPGPRPGFAAGHFYVAWESGSHATWHPAACSPYVLMDMSKWFH